MVHSCFKTFAEFNLALNKSLGIQAAILAIAAT